jgi:hypothetical protein
LAEEILQRIGQRHISRMSIWRSTQAVGAKFQALETLERKRATALPEQWKPPSRAQVADQRMGVAMDGALVNIRKEGWKEVKIGNVFTIALTAMPDKATGELVELARADANSYVAHLGGPELLGDLTWADARRRGWEQAQDTQVLGDGAAWIWNLASHHFGNSQQVVDWYHAKQHLIAAARLLKKEGSAAFSRWLNSRATFLYQGHAARIADELDRAVRKQPNEQLASEATFFRNHHLRMQYLELRENAGLIGSGMVESGAKQFKARFAGPGMRWSRTGTNNLLPIRSAILSNRFNERWAVAKFLPPA